MIKVSIIIPTYNRPSYLNRVLSYYSDYKTDYNIIIADSSSDENKKKNKEIINNFPDLNISYFSEYPIDISPNLKIFYALDHVKSRYCVICADDDFITLDGINLSANFLENNPDFIVAQGQYVGFYLKTKKNGEKQFCWKWLYPPQSIVFQNPVARLKSYLTNYLSPIFYAVYRTDSLKMIFGESLKSKVEHFRFFELLLAMLTIIYGKIKCLDVFYSARSEPLLSMDEKDKATRDYLTSAKNTLYDEEYIKSKNCLAVHLNKLSLIDIEESEKIIDNAMVAHFKKDYPDVFKRFLRDKIIKDIFNYLNLPDSFYAKIRSFYLSVKLNFSKPKDNFLNSLDNPLSEHFDDFSKIRNCVISHPKI